MKSAALLAALLLVTPALVQEFESPPEWTAAIAPFQIADQLYWVGSQDLAAFLFTSDDGHILIDATLDENVPMVLENIRALGFDPADVEVLLASQAHFDHVGGVASLKEATGADLVLSVADGELVANGGAAGAEGLEAFRPVPPDRTIGHLETVTVGSNTLTAHLTPGHTPGCTSWSGTVTIEGEPASFVSVCSLSVLPDYRLVGPDATYAGIAADYCTSVDHLNGLDPQIFLAPHGSMIGAADKVAALAAGNRRAFVDPDRYHRYLTRAAERIDEILIEQGEAGGCAAVLGTRAP